MTKRRVDDRFYWRSGRDGATDKIELDCRNWRHGECNEEFEFAVRPNRAVQTSGAIIVEVHASNLSVATTANLPVRICFPVGSTIERARAAVDRLASQALADGRI